MNLLTRNTVPGHVPDQLSNRSLLCMPLFNLKGHFPDLEQAVCSHDEPEGVYVCVSV